MMRLYGDRISGNCLKVKWVSDWLSIPYEWIDIDILKSESRTPEFLAMNPAGQVPTVMLDDGRTLAQSNAIIRYLARGSDLLPDDPYLAAKADEWMFWEQYSHEPYIAVCRFQMKYLGKSAAELDPERVKRGHTALARMELQLGATPFLVGGRLSLADIALVAYTRMAGDGGFDLATYSGVSRWVGHVERELGIGMYQ